MEPVRNLVDITEEKSADHPFVSDAANLVADCEKAISSIPPEGCPACPILSHGMVVNHRVACYGVMRLSRSSRRLASGDPNWAARSYQFRACAGSGWNPSTPSSANTTGSNVDPSASAA